MDGSVLEDAGVWGWLSLLNWIGALTLFPLRKLPPRKLETWFILWSSFLLLHGILLSYLAGFPSCYLELLDKLQKRICRTVGPSLAVSLEPLAHCRNIASLSLCYRYYFGRCSSEPAELVPLPYYRGRSTRYSDRLHDFSVATPRCYKDTYVNSFFPRTARFRNSVSVECFPLTYDLSGFKSRINKHFLTVGSY